MKPALEEAARCVGSTVFRAELEADAQALADARTLIDLLKEQLAHEQAVNADVRTLDAARAEGYDFGQPYPITRAPDSPWRIESSDSEVYWEGPTPDAARHAAAEWVRSQR